MSEKIFCSACGKQCTTDDKFCPGCGKSLTVIGNTSIQTEQGVTSTFNCNPPQKTKKGLARIIIGIIMLSFQALGIFGNVINTGKIIPLPAGNTAYSLGYITGYFLIGIIGLVLLLSGISAKKKSLALKK